MADQASVEHDRMLELRIAQARSVNEKKNDPELAEKRRIGLASNNCAECGNEIAPARLKAFPGALRCVFCEERRENAVRH